MHELLIIGPAAWRKSLDRFARYKSDTALPAAVVTIEDAEAQLPGVDGPEKIKRCIEREHRLRGTKYVLLVGDANVFPVRYIRAVNTEWGTIFYPSDLYYADLYDTTGAFDDWDADGDGIYAEMDFKETSSGPKFNIDKVNLVPDVVVGRVPASTLAEADTYFHKVMGYEFAARESVAFGYPSRWFRKALIVGGNDGFGNKAVSNQHAAPLADAGFTIVRRYRDEQPWSSMDDAGRAGELTRLLEEGAGFLHYYAHGNTNSFSGWFADTDVAGVDNAGRLPVLVAISCLTARFAIDKNAYLTAMGTSWTGTSEVDRARPVPAPVQPADHDRDSMAEEFLVKRESGAVAYIGAAHKFEHGGKPLGAYLFEAYRDLPKPPTLGDMWGSALRRFVANELGGGTIGMGPYYAFIHAHKVMLFGDPSLRVGGLQQRWLQNTGALDVALMDEALGG
jgi:hypothetical protein